MPITTSPAGGAGGVQTSITNGGGTVAVASDGTINVTAASGKPVNMAGGTLALHADVSDPDTAISSAVLGHKFLVGDVGSEVLILEVQPDSVDANGALTATTAAGSHAMTSTVTGSLSFSTANVISLKHANVNGASAIQLLRGSDGFEVGAIGYKNAGGTATYLDGAVYVASGLYRSVDGTGSATIIPIIIGQESTGGIQARMTFTSDKSITFHKINGTVHSKVGNDGGWMIGSTGAAATSQALDVIGSTIVGNYTDQSGRNTVATDYALSICDTRATILKLVRANVGGVDIQYNGTGATRTLDFVDEDGGTPLQLLLNGTGGAKLNGTVTFTGGSLTGGAGNMTITAGTGNSRTLIFKSTTSGGTATTALTLGADQSATFAGIISGNGSGLTNLPGGSFDPHSPGAFGDLTPGTVACTTLRANSTLRAFYIQLDGGTANSRFEFYPPANGVCGLYDGSDTSKNVNLAIPAADYLALRNGSNAQTFGLGPATTDGILLKQASGVLTVRLGDDSAAGFEKAKQTTDTAATTGLTAGVLSALTNATIVLYDSTGQAYRVPCII